MNKLLEKFSKFDVKEVLKNPSILLKHSFVKYLITGFSTFAIDFGLFQTLHTLFGLSEVVSNATSVLISLFYNFMMSNYWTFQAGTGKDAKKITKYLILAIVNYFFNIAAFAFLIAQFDLSGLFAKVIVTGTIALWNYLIFKLWIFKED